MSVDWAQVWTAAVTAAEDVVKAKAPAAKGFVRDIMQAREQRLKLLMVAWADGALDQDTLEEELKEEQAIVAMEFHAIRVLARKTAQDAANAAFKVIGDALLKGIGLVV
jgi:hypothetical protein